MRVAVSSPAFHFLFCREVATNMPYSKGSAEVTGSEAEPETSPIPHLVRFFLQESLFFSRGNVEQCSCVFMRQFGDMISLEGGTLT